MRILIADDDLTCRILLKEVMEKRGYETLEAADGLETLKQIQKPDAPELAIIDWMMPEIDGLEVVRRIRIQESGLSPYIIMLTTRGDKHDVIAGLESGADDYLIKPFNIGELLARLSVGKRIIDMQKRLAVQVEELRVAMDHIETLRGILPICSFCNNIRNEEGGWERVDTYISRHSRAEFSHTVCPECMARHYPEYDAEGSNDC
jgi:DNA-binding response OmpR family regulator